MDYSSYQQAVFADTESGAGHTVIEALAGSGKTTTIVEALKYVTTKKEVLFCAFATKNVEDLQDKVPWTVDVSTTHSYGKRVLEYHFGRLRVDKGRTGAIVSEMFVGRARESYDLRDRLVAAVSKAKSTLASTAAELDEMCDAFYINTDGAVRLGVNDPDPTRDRVRFIEYVQAALERCRMPDGSIDFDDMVWLPVVLDLPLIQYARVFGDEVQDWAPAQIEMIQRAVRPTGRLCAVGDRHQAIYGFRGADAQAVPRLITRMKAKTLPLPICYRCPTAVVEFARKMVPALEAAPGAAAGLVDTISYERFFAKVRPGNFVLSRSNAGALETCFALLQRGRRALILGKDIGSALASTIRKSNTRTVPALLEYIRQWVRRETQRLTEAGHPDRIAPINDRAACIVALCEDADSIAEVLDRIALLFKDANEDNSVVCSTVHKAKGLERNRVFLINRTFRVTRAYWAASGMPEWQIAKKVDEAWRTPEEVNIYYVAATRARRELYLVE